MEDTLLIHRVRNLKYHQLSSYNPTKVLYYATYLGIVPVAKWAVGRGGDYEKEYNEESIIDLSDRMVLESNGTLSKCHQQIFAFLVDLQFEKECVRDFYID